MRSWNWTIKNGEIDWLLWSEFQDFVKSENWDELDLLAEGLGEDEDSVGLPGHRQVDWHYITAQSLHGQD